ncbi:hypothetical protein T492DRAFT_1123585, partial [Pavlovales sp. CCMP2436]
MGSISKSVRISTKRTLFYRRAFRSLFRSSEFGGRLAPTLTSGSSVAMPYLTHADAEVAKAVEAEAAARSKIAVTAPARKPVIATTAPARNGEAERIIMCAEEEREEEEEERNAETILCTSARFKFLLLARLRRLSWPKGEGGWHCSCGAGGVWHNLHQLRATQARPGGTPAPPGPPSPPLPPCSHPPQTTRACARAPADHISHHSHTRVCVQAEPELCAGGGADPPWQGLQEGRQVLPALRATREERRLVLIPGRAVDALPERTPRRPERCVRLHDRLADLRDDLRDIDGGKHANELDERLRLIPHDRILHYRPEQGHLAHQSRRCCNGKQRPKQPGPGEWSPKDVRQSPANRSPVVENRNKTENVQP